MHVDITERKKAEGAQLVRDQEFEALVENAPDIISRYDRQFRHLYVNRAITGATGLPASAFIGKTHGEMGMPPDLQAEWRAAVEGVFASGQEAETEFEFKTPAGTRYYHSRLVPERTSDGSIRTVLNIARDVTERHAAEQALRASEERYRATFDQAPVGVCQMTFDGKFEKVNPRLCELLGYSSAELLKLKFSDITYPEDLPRSVQLVAELAQQQRNFFATDKRYLRKDGRVIWALSTVSLMRDADGKPQSLIAIVEDISARKEAEEKLLFQAHMLDHIGEAIIATSPDGTVIYWNRRAESLYGWSKAEAIGRPVMEIAVPETTRPDADAVMEMMRRGGRSSGEYLLRHRDGSTFPAFVSNSVLVDAQGEIQAIIGISQDVTERNRARRRLVDSEARLRALTGRLEKSREEERTRIAREIHDELGQLLTGLKMDLRWVENWLEKNDDPKLRPFLDRIVGGTELTDTVIKAVQAIATDLRPGVLDTLGLAAAL